MKQGIIILAALVFLFATDTTSNAQAIELESQQVDFHMPDGWTMGEVVAIEKRADGHFVVLHRGQHQLVEFDADRNFVKEIGAGLFKNPHGLRIDPLGNIWTADSGTHLVLRFAPSGKVTMVLGKNGTAGTGWFDRDYNLVLFDQPLDIAWDKDDNIYVVDKGNARIVKMDANGAMIKTWGQQGTHAGEFNFAHSIIIDDLDRIYIADRENKRIQIFDLEGNFLSQWDDVGYPYVLTLAHNTLWVTDARAEKVRQFDLNGILLNSYQGHAGRNPGQFSAVHGIQVSEDGTIMVTQIFNWAGVNQLTPVPHTHSQ